MYVCMYAYTSFICYLRGMPTRHLNYCHGLRSKERRYSRWKSSACLSLHLYQFCILHHANAESKKKKTAAPVSNLVIKVDLDSDR